MEPVAEKALAKKLFNACWDLIEKPNRNAQEDAQMLHLAHASRWHWGNVGSEKEFAIGEWQCARVNAILGNAKAALLHATLSAEFAEQLPDTDFMKASSAEALAYAHHLMGDPVLAQKYKDRAVFLLEFLELEEAQHIKSQILELPF